MLAGSQTVETERTVFSGSVARTRCIWPISMVFVRRNKNIVLFVINTFVGAARGDPVVWLRSAAAGFGIHFIGA